MPRKAANPIRTSGRRDRQAAMRLRVMGEL
jgi:hypothetical protein